MFSLAVYHRAASPERVRALQAMVKTLENKTLVSFRIFDEPAQEPRLVWQHTLYQTVWKWSLETGAEHCVFMTDDLHVCPEFWPILSAMVSAKPDDIIGLLSNHPSAPALADRGVRWYRCNGWVVGPAYVMPRGKLDLFRRWHREWIETVPDRTQYGDDSSLNVWISTVGPHESWHPLPTIIEHRGDIETTWHGGGDCFSRERVSWRAHRTAPLDDTYRGVWTTTERHYDLEAMSTRAYWVGSGPMLRIVGAREDEGRNWIGRPDAPDNGTVW